MVKASESQIDNLVALLDGYAQEGGQGQEYPYLSGYLGHHIQPFIGRSHGHV